MYIYLIYSQLLLKEYEKEIQSLKEELAMQNTLVPAVYMYMYNVCARSKVAFHVCIYHIHVLYNVLGICMCSGPTCSSLQVQRGSAVRARIINDIPDCDEHVCMLIMRIHVDPSIRASC